MSKSAQCTYSDGPHSAPKCMPSNLLHSLVLRPLAEVSSHEARDPPRTQDLSEGVDDDPHWRPNTKEFYLSQPAKSSILAGNFRPHCESSGARLPMTELSVATMSITYSFVKVLKRRDALIHRLGRIARSREGLLVGRCRCRPGRDLTVTASFAIGQQRRLGRPSNGKANDTWRESWASRRWRERSTKATSLPL